MTEPSPLATMLAGAHFGALATLKRDGRPQLSMVGYSYDAEADTIRVSVTDSRAKTANIRRDDRVSLMVTSKDGWSYVVADGAGRLSPVAAAPDDATVDALVDLYRTLSGEHPDWDEFRAAMVADGRILLTVEVTHLYGTAR